MNGVTASATVGSADSKFNRPESRQIPGGIHELCMRLEDHCRDHGITESLRTITKAAAGGAASFFTKLGRRVEKL